jgi:hypothetical protein
MPQEEKIDVEIHTYWGHYNTSLLTSKLYRHVERQEIEFELEARSGSVITTFIIGFTGSLAAGGILELAKYLLKRSQRAKEENNEVEEPELVVNYPNGESERFKINQDTIEDIKRIFGEK